MADFFLLTLALAVIILLFSMFSRRFERRLLYPVVFSILSILIFIFSLIFGGWEGMGLGVLSIALLLGSLLSFIFIVFLYRLTHRR